MEMKHESTDILAEQREYITNGTDRLLVDIYKNCLVSVTESLKAYANAFHNGMPGHVGSFSICQHPVCQHGRTVIDGAIAVVAGEATDG